MKRLVLTVAAVLAASCQVGPNTGLDDVLVCTDVFIFGVNVTVLDEADEPIAGALLTLTDGDYTETMDDLGDGQYTGAGERAGTYTLTVQADGFETETVEAIMVGADECHVIPEARTVTLTEL